MNDRGYFTTLAELPRVEGFCLFGEAGSVSIGNSRF